VQIEVQKQHPAKGGRSSTGSSSGRDRSGGVGSGTGGASHSRTNQSGAASEAGRSSSRWSSGRSDRSDRSDGSAISANVQARGLEEIISGEKPEINAYKVQTFTGSADVNWLLLNL
jgi:hypothetical protein